MRKEEKKMVGCFSSFFADSLYDEESDARLVTSYIAVKLSLL